MIESADTRTVTAELWPIFICYRQVDGLPAARRLYELLDKHRHKVRGTKGQTIQFDVYLDQTMPAVADWRKIHQPYLKRARALIVVCTPGAKIKDGPEDWVHREIKWWLDHREPVPILIDPLDQGIRYVPTAISKRWPQIQRIPLVESEWIGLSRTDLEQKASALRGKIVGNILPSGAAIYEEELKAERRRAAKLRVALRAAEISGRVSEASLHDAKSAAYFAEARRHEARWETVRQRQIEVGRALSALGSEAEDAAGLRRQNLNFEYRQLGETMNTLAARAAEPRQHGYAELKLADDAWRALERDRQSTESRKPPEPPYIFSVELITAGSGAGECILIHYGTPDATRMVMVNGGRGATFENSVGKRLQSLKAQRFGGRPVPIDLFIVGDQDENKTGGLLKMLQQQAVAADARDHLVELRAVWANIFASTGFRGAIRESLEQLGIPWNFPFDHLVMRPEQGRLTYTLPDGLEIVVVGPQRTYLEELHTYTRRSEEGRDAAGSRSGKGTVAFPEEKFSRLNVSDGGDRLPPTPLFEQDGRCMPSENARRRASVGNLDKSIPNLASTVLLFRYRGKTFLHTGDSRADLITNGLRSSGLMAGNASAHVDLLLLPHSGSKNNLTPEFLERVTADEYLFTSDGTMYGFSIETVAALIAARPCAEYTMYFVNRDSPAPGRPRAAVPDETTGKPAGLGESLDTFFAAEEQYSPRYRRLFRATDQGSVIIDLLDRLTY